MVRALSFTLVSLAVVFTAQAKKPRVANPAFSVVQNEWNFGRVAAYSKHGCTFEFVNNSREPLKIDGIISSCSCVKVSYPKDEIAPGESGSLNVSFDTAGYEGIEVRKGFIVVSGGKKYHNILVVTADVMPPRLKSLAK